MHIIQPKTSFVIEVNSANKTKFDFVRLRVK